MLKYTKIILLLTNVINNEERITHSRQFPKTINSNSVATITQLEIFKQVYINKRILWHLSRSFTTITASLSRQRDSLESKRRYRFICTNRTFGYICPRPKRSIPYDLKNTRNWLVWAALKI